MSIKITVKPLNIEHFQSPKFYPQFRSEGVNTKMNNKKIIITILFMIFKLQLQSLYAPYASKFKQIIKFI